MKSLQLLFVQAALRCLLLMGLAQVPVVEPVVAVIVDALIALGCWFTFGVETRHSPLIQALARAAPPDRILTETDGPEGLRWLTGEVGMPHHLLEVLEVLAALRGLSVAEMEASVAANWRRLVEADTHLQRWGAVS